MDTSARYRPDAPTREAIDAESAPLLLEFGTGWCGHCRAARGAVDEALAAYPGVKHLAIEDGPGRRLGRTFGVKLWPTLIALQAGREIERVVRPREASVVRSLLARLTSSG